MIYHPIKIKRAKMFNSNNMRQDNRPGKLYTNVDRFTKIIDDQPIVTPRSLGLIRNNEYAIIRLSGGYNNVEAPFILVQRVQGKLTVFATDTIYTSPQKLVNDLLIEKISNDQQFIQFIQNVERIVVDERELSDMLRHNNAAFAPRIITTFENNKESLRHCKLIM